MALRLATANEKLSLCLDTGVTVIKAPARQRLPKY